MLPTNIFLQNTTAFPYLVEIEECSGLLEIVTRGTMTKQHQEDEGNNAIMGSSSAYKRSAVTFRVSAVRGFFSQTLLISTSTHRC